LELDASEDGALEGLGECLVYLGGAGELALKGVKESQTRVTADGADEAFLLLKIQSV
jgi:hypothetical protein